MQAKVGDCLHDAAMSASDSASPNESILHVRISVRPNGISIFVS